MLLVDDDETKVSEGGEQRAACTDGDHGLSGPDAPPLSQALGAGQAGVQHRDGIPEARPEAPGQQRRQADLRDQHEDLPSPVEDLCRRPQVDLCLAAAGNPME